MKLGIAGARTSAWAKVDWIEQAARNLGHDVRRSTDWHELPPLLAECDVVIFGQKHLAGRWPNVRDALASRRAKAVYWWFDLIATQPGVRIAEQPIFDTFQNLLRACDLVLVKERGLLDEYREAGVNAAYCDQGCPSWLPAAVRPARAEPKWDLLVWGQAGPYRQRVRDVQAAVSAGFKVAWACQLGNVPAGAERLPFTPPMELPALAAQARCVLSCGARSDIEGYWSDGFWIALGMGACVARRSTPGLPDGSYLTYHTEPELCSALDWIKRNPTKAADVGRKAREWVMAEHTTEHYLNRVLALSARIAREPESSRLCETARA